MKKFFNHVDHVTWISRPENLAANVALLETLADAKMTRFERADMGFVMYLCWEAGLEVVSPLPEPTEFNKLLYDRLDQFGEGLMSVIFGVDDLDKHRARLEKLGFAVGEEMDDHPDSPWHHQLRLRERLGGVVMNSWFILGDIDYADGMIRFGDAP